MAGPARPDSFCLLCQQTIYCVGALHGLRPGELDDFAQDAWLAVLTSLAAGHFDPSRGTARDWLFTVIRNRAVTAFRRRCQLENRLVDLPLEFVPGLRSDDPSVISDRRGDIELVRAALPELRQRISEVAYQVFVLRYLEEISAADVAAQLGLSDVQVRVYAHRGRRKLAEILAHQDS